LRQDAWQRARRADSRPFLRPQDIDGLDPQRSLVDATVAPVTHPNRPCAGLQVDARGPPAGTMADGYGCMLRIRPARVRSTSPVLARPRHLAQAARERRRECDSSTESQDANGLPWARFQLRR